MGGTYLAIGVTVALVIVFLIISSFVATIVATKIGTPHPTLQYPYSAVGPG